MTKMVKNWFYDNNIIMHSTFNESQSIVVERFIKTLRKKSIKKMAATASYCYVAFYIN